MPFFIIGRTKCAICHQPIKHRFDAAELPYIDPNVSKSLSQLARNFVHRQCWKEWEEAKLFSTLAFDLVGGEQPFAPTRGSCHDSALKIEFESDELILFWVAALNSYRLQDFKLLVTVEMPLTEFPGIVDFFVSALSHQGFTKEYQIGSYIWKARWVDSALEFTVCEELEIVDRFVVPPDRQSCWLAVMKAMLNTVIEKMGDGSANEFGDRRTPTLNERNAKLTV